MIRRIGAAALRAALVAAFVGAVSPAAAEDAPAALAALADTVYASDSDGFRAIRIRVGGLYPYANPWRFAGAATQDTRYAQGDFRKDVPGILGLYRDQRRDTLAGIDVEAGVVRVSGHLRPVGDATWRLLPLPDTAVDLIASADLVETPQALDLGIGYTFVAAGIEHALSERFTATGLAGWQSFTDGNSRLHLRARLIFLAAPEHGITLQLRYRQYDSSQSDVDGAYFNPDEYRQWLGVAAVRRRYAGWILSGAAGAGSESSTGTASHPSYLAEARAEGPLAGDARVILRAGYYRSAGFIEAPDYAYYLIGATLVLPFR